ncbi:hypothetical protein DS031_14360 [Bacillus taeanensis]|uniref:Uncharacterized protein n=1 Tax=Bacillus taeanensis TaxID=273032 RepID=A0A366XXP7_9BACI|nr:hypothetical protein DS031_14360 [Bacillus taeanensis]
MWLFYGKETVLKYNRLGATICKISPRERDTFREMFDFITAYKKERPLFAPFILIQDFNGIVYIGPLLLMKIVSFQNGQIGGDCLFAGSDP